MVPSVVDLEFTKRKLKYAYLSVHLSLGQQTTILKCAHNSCTESKLYLTVHLSVGGIHKQNFRPHLSAHLSLDYVLS